MFLSAHHLLCQTWPCSSQLFFGCLLLEFVLGEELHVAVVVHLGIPPKTRTQLLQPSIEHRSVPRQARFRSLFFAHISRLSFFFDFANVRFPSLSSFFLKMMMTAKTTFSVAVAKVRVIMCALLFVCSCALFCLSIVLLLSVSSSEVLAFRLWRCDASNP